MELLGEGFVSWELFHVLYSYKKNGIILELLKRSFYTQRLKKTAGQVEMDVQGVPWHTQYLAKYSLSKDQVLGIKIWIYLLVSTPNI